MLDIVRENIVATNSLGWAVKGDVAEQVVFARKQHLEEAKIRRLMTRFNINYKSSLFPLKLKPQRLIKVVGL